MIVCKYCDKTLTNHNNLAQHYKSRYCQDHRSEKIQNEYSCEYCIKAYSRQTNLTRHLTLCSKKEIYDTKQKYKTSLKECKKREKDLVKNIKTLEDKNKKNLNQIKNLQTEIERQNGIIEGMQRAPDKKTIYNTAIHPKLINLPINNIPALTDEYVSQKVNDGILTYEKASRGYPGILEVFCDLITHENADGQIERNYVCTDVSRNSFHRLLESKKWKSDKGGKYLNTMLDTFSEVITDHKNKAYQIYKSTSHDSFEWEQIDWDRKNISKLYSGIVCRIGSGDREELVNILRREISNRASV